MGTIDDIEWKAELGLCYELVAGHCPGVYFQDVMKV